jgi:hypothetical protein
LVYIYAPGAGGRYQDFFPERFVESYHQFPPNIEHESIVVCNGAKADSTTRCLFSPFKNVRLIPYNNAGYDIGGFQFAAQNVGCDMMVFFGGSAFFKRAGWLFRMAEAFHLHGPALYGATANRGNLSVKVWPHIRTTAFWCPPGWMNEYPKRVTRADQRFPFEHGPDNFTEWVRKRKGSKAWLVSWDGEYQWERWDTVRGGYTHCPQTNVLAYDRMCEPPYVNC